MIQRIQTLFLLVSAILMALLLFSPLFVYGSNGIFAAIHCHMGFGFAAAFILVALVDIFMFRNRRLQIRLTWIAIGLNLAVLFFYGVHFYFLTAGKAPAAAGDAVGIKPFALIPLVTLVFTVLALRGIRKDEKLVRESDRLR